MDIEMFSRMAFALALVLGLLGLMAAALKVWGSRIGLVGVLNGQAGAKNKPRRLTVMEATLVDARHRLVLIRRDDVEHLVMLGGTHPVVIESCIKTSPSA